MLSSRAVFDHIRLPVHVPGNLDCRMQLASFRPDGTWINDGSRGGAVEREKWRLVLEPGQSIEDRVGESFTRNVCLESGEIVEAVGPLARLGYEPPDTGIVHHIAAHEWDEAVLAARRDRLRVVRPELRLVVRALAFGLVGDGELLVSFGKATVRPGGADVTQKKPIRLYPGDPLHIVIAGLDRLAELIGYAPLCDEDVSLLHHVARRLWTNEAISQRIETTDALYGADATAFRALDFARRFDGLGDFTDIPAGARPDPQPMRSIN